MTINTTSSDARLRRPHGSPWAALALLLPGLLLLPAGKDNRRRAARLASGVLLLLAFSVAGCGSSGSGSGNTYSVVVSASATGATSSTTTISVTVIK
jgi:hypothetical protein